MRRQAGDIEYAGGFRFVWDEDGTGAVWRDSTEQDYTGEPSGYVRTVTMPPGAVAVSGTATGDAMVMSTLDGAAAFVWGYWTARHDVQTEERESLARQSSSE